MSSHSTKMCWGAGRFRAQLTHLYSLVHAMAVQHLRTDWDLFNIQPHSTARGPPPQVLTHTQNRLLQRCGGTSGRLKTVTDMASHTHDGRSWQAAAALRGHIRKLEDQDSPGTAQS